MGRAYAAIAMAMILSTACVSTFDPDSVALEGDPDAGGNNNGDANNGNDVPDTDVPEGECNEGEDCDFGQPGVLATCTSGVCTPTGCADGVSDCNDDYDTDGCETDVTTLENCGACGVDCEGDNAVWACNGGSCVVEDCESGWRDGDGDAENGCEEAVPPRPVVEAVDVRNHGIHVTWSLRDESANVTHFEIAWGPEPDNMGRSRTIEGGHFRAATVGPVAAEGTIYVAVRALEIVDEERTEGEPSDPFLYEFVPAGWFNRSAGRFWTDGFFIDGSGGVLSAYGHIAHISGARGTSPIPGRLAFPRQVISIDAAPAGTPGEAVVGSFEGYVQVTRDHGVTWQEHPTPEIENVGDGGLFVARILSNSRIVTCGNLISWSDDYGESFQQVEPPSEHTQTLFFGGHSFFADGADYIFCQGYSFDDQTAPLVAWSGDGGDSWTYTVPTVDVQTRFDIAGGIHMISPTTGFMGAPGGVWRTEDQWATASLIELNAPDSDEHSIFRIRFDNQGNGIAASVNAPWMFATDDGGESWALTAEMPAIQGTDSFFAGVVPLGGVAQDPFLLLGTEGTVLRWEGATGNRTFSPQRRGYTGDFVGISAVEGETLVISSDQAILRATGSPEGLVPEGVIANRSDRLNAAAASKAGELVVAVGDAGQLHWSSNNGRTWTAAEPDPLESVQLVDVSVDDRGTMGFAVGDGGPNRGLVSVRILGNPPQIQVLAPRSVTSGVDPTELVPKAVDVSNDGRLVVIAVEHSRTSEQFFFTGRGADEPVWTTVPFGGRGRVQAVGLIRASTDFYAVGTQGLFVRVVDGEPVSVDLPVPSGLSRTDLDFVSVTFPHDRLNGWAFTANGWIFATRDGGETWSFDRGVPGVDGEDDREGDGDYPHRLTRMWVSEDNDHLLIAGTRGTVLWTANGGVPNPPIQ